MPIPKPHKGERREEFISRCAQALATEFPEKEQRLAVCYSAWRRAGKEKSR